jgi:HEAT repeat protein
MSPDRRSIEERLAEITRDHESSRVVYIRPPSSPIAPGFPPVAYSNPPFTRRQLAKFFLGLALLLLLAFAGWRFFRVTLQLGKLRNPDAAVRVHAAAELGRFRSARAVPPLIAALGDADSRVQIAAAQALGQIADPRAFAPLLATLKGAKDYDEVRNACAVALGSLGPSALPPLLAALHDSDLAGAAGQGLVQLGAPAVDPLLALLGGSDPDLRQQAAELLGAIPAPRAVPSLIAALQDKESYVRKYAAAALGAIRDPRADQPLIAATKDQDQNVRQAAARSLGQMDDPQSTHFLLMALQQRNTDVIAGASDFYIKRGDPGSEAALIEALNQSGDQYMAADFLNSGNQKLHDAATGWASRNNYEINYMPGGGAAAWGGKK